MALETGPTATRRPHVRARTRLLLATLLIGVLIVLGFVTPSPYIIERPGPVVNTLGNILVDGEERPVVNVEGAETFATEGELNLLTVTIVGNPDQPLGWLSLVPAFFDRTQELRPMQDVFSGGMTSQQRDEANAVMMDRSQQEATAAALGLLGMAYDSTVTVDSVLPDTPASQVLQEGDVILASDGEPVTGGGALRTRIATHEPGVPMTLLVRRGGADVAVEIVPVRADGQTRSHIGVMLTSEYVFPVDIDIALDRIGGPSAGMMFALGIYDELTAESLTSGLIVSGTGTVDEDGNVGAIGGLPQKIWGASRANTDVFLMPVENCAHVPAVLPDDMTIVPVETAREAIAAIQEVSRGATPQGLERCERSLARD